MTDDCKRLCRAARHDSCLTLSLSLHLSLSVTPHNSLHDQRIIEKELEGFGIRLNQQPPNIILKRKEKGGISITKACTLTKSVTRGKQRMRDACSEMVASAVIADARRCGSSRASRTG